MKELQKRILQRVGGVSKLHKFGSCLDFGADQIILGPFMFSVFAISALEIWVLSSPFSPIFKKMPPPGELSDPNLKPRPTYTKITYVTRSSRCNIAARDLATYLIPGCVGRGVRLGSEGSSVGGGVGGGGVWKSGNLS